MHNNNNINDLLIGDLLIIYYLLLPIVHENDSAYYNWCNIKLPVNVYIVSNVSCL